MGLLGLCQAMDKRIRLTSVQEGLGWFLKFVLIVTSMLIGNFGEHLYLY